MQNERIFKHDEYVLKKERYHSSGLLYLEALDAEFTAQYMVDALTESLCVRVIKDIYATTTRTVTHSLEQYASPWEHFKAVYMPKWFVDKFPIKKTTVKYELDVKAYFPEIKVLGQEYRFRALKTDLINPLN